MPPEADIDVAPGAPGVVVATTAPDASLQTTAMPDSGPSAPTTVTTTGAGPASVGASTAGAASGVASTGASIEVGGASTAASASAGGVTASISEASKVGSGEPSGGAASLLEKHAVHATGKMPKKTSLALILRVSGAGGSVSSLSAPRYATLRLSRWDPSLPLAVPAPRKSTSARQPGASPKRSRSSPPVSNPTAASAIDASSIEPSSRRSVRAL